MSLRGAVWGLAMASAMFGQQDRMYTDIPFVPTPDHVVKAMLDLAEVRASDVLVDLGSGDGRIVIAAAKRGVPATGVEIDPDLVERSRKLAAQEGVAEHAKFVRADLFAYDLRNATVVTMYLTPGVNLRLRAKLLRELRPGTRVVSHRFNMGNWAPAKKVDLGDDPIFLWVIPKGGVPCLEGVSGCSSETAVAPAAASAEKPSAMFSYDAAAPLSSHWEEPVLVKGCHVIAGSYLGGRGPVSATLVTPPQAGKYPAIIFLHDGRRDEFLPEALLLASAKEPVVALLLDPPPERPVGWRRSYNSLIEDNDRDIHIQSVIDVRRGIDVLASRPEVDASHIAYVGRGYGANWGAILASFEPRVRGFVLISGFPSLADLMAGDDPEWANLRFGLGSERFASYRASLSTMDPIRFTRFWAGAPILFQFGRFDPFVTHAMAEQLVHSIPRPQQALFYDAGHAVNDPQASLDRARFLEQCLRGSTARPAQESR